MALPIDAPKPLTAAANGTSAIKRSQVAANFTRGRTKEPFKFRNEYRNRSDMVVRMSSIGIFGPA